MRQIFIRQSIKSIWAGPETEVLIKQCSTVLQLKFVSTGELSHPSSLMFHQGFRSLIVGHAERERERQAPRPIPNSTHPSGVRVMELRPSDRFLAEFQKRHTAAPSPAKSKRCLIEYRAQYRTRTHSFWTR
ncbi:unnamed protein product [Tuber aestivum]|uniref:Uncharacterized protein n=1 Tax=Tuber aestivum TaxID=59557 RepID=A0A292PLY8_9PEZI|nr:unnamed protein product [Tuber aestivum]